MTTTMTMTMTMRARTMSREVDRTRRLLLGAALALPLAGCWGGAPKVLHTPLGQRSLSLPTQARRVVCLEFVFTEAVLSLGLTPVGVADPDVYRRWVGIEAQRLEQVASVGTRQQPDLEAIAALQPDLIIGYAQRHSRIAEQLATIAPTLVYDLEPVPGQGDALTRLRAVCDDLATHVAASAAAQALARRLDDALARTRAQVERLQLAERPTALLNPLTEDGSFWGFDRRSSVGALLDKVGLRNAWATTSERQMGVRLSMNALFAHSDWLLLLIDRPDRPLYQQRLWQQVPAVKAGRVGFLPRDTWTFGGLTAMTTFAGRVGQALPGLR
ncbi:MULTISPECIES: iron-siderophore ABC transporter substrate-binding protein [Pseudomonas]|uniref:Iron-siderophore ABC transporter substrate-binding protein n=1 Tax=Pseudomonas quercus TaxID=2722792 RepID=A0ABX0YAL5_9PSED|nr:MULTISPECIES: iron-siderophore ABC transporter substrate-binding protein [Pseudomonas]MBF7140777.1 iron-siderophore ABC transporter substrate-binding protein [Pseudomonas sp. LY10J]NJO99313.1 iron-siderophore ABC transporter substrate-binding protein [Pseudomonas quercus]